MTFKEIFLTTFLFAVAAVLIASIFYLEKLKQETREEFASAISTITNPEFFLATSTFHHSITFQGSSTGTPLIEMTSTTFFYKGEPIEDAQGVYDKMVKALNYELCEPKELLLP